MIRDLAHAAADALDAIGEATWRDWLANTFTLAVVVAFVAAAAAIAIAAAPVPVPV